MHKTTLTIILLITSIFVAGQIAPDKYFVQFSDKNLSQYSIDKPEEFLSSKSIDRRQRQNIPITDTDIPVVKQYIDIVKNIGVTILNTTKWLNGVTIYTDNPDLLDEINSLSFVTNTLKVSTTNSGTSIDKFKIDDIITSNKTTTSTDYGYAFGQIDQLSGIDLHENGYWGENMIIAVLDAGFTGVKEHPVFGYLWENNRILGTKDFVTPDGDVFEGSRHGEMVLSCMGANLSGEMIGTAPEASYWLLKSEDASSENIIEEYNWVSAAEFADSVGVDIINSSLSYTLFDMSQWDHSQSEMNGHTAPASIGASYAASIGIFVCNSAGNSSGVDWVGSPGDGDNVFTVGAVLLNGQRASFSSIGPTADGRTVPVIMACGQGATVATGSSDINTSANGTSFSSPIMAGMVACLWQKHYNLPMINIQNAIKESGNNANSINNLSGWGIPNFMIADSILTAQQPIIDNNIAIAGPTPTSSSYNIFITDPLIIDINIKIYSLDGKLIMNRDYNISSFVKTINLDKEVNNIKSGSYFIKITSDKKEQILNLIKQ